MKKILWSAVLMLGASPLAAAPVLHVQGRLSDAQGRPVSGVTALDFRIVDRYDPAEVWNEVHEVEVVRGVFVVTLGLRERLPDPRLVAAGWKLKATPPIGSGLAVGELQVPDDHERLEKLARLLARLNGEAPAPLPAAPAAYLALLSPAAPAAEAPPADPFARAPERHPCAETSSACPEDIQKVLTGEERLLRRRLARLARQDRPAPGAYVRVLAH